MSSYRSYRSYRSYVSGFYPIHAAVRPPLLSSLLPLLPPLRLLLLLLLLLVSPLHPMRAAAGVPSAPDAVSPQVACGLTDVYDLLLELPPAYGKTVPPGRRADASLPTAHGRRALQMMGLTPIQLAT